jgi:hypothetical protein
LLSSRSWPSTQGNPARAARIAMSAGAGDSSVGWVSEWSCCTVQNTPVPAGASGTLVACRTRAKRNGSVMLPKRDRRSRRTGPHPTVCLP